VGRGLVIGDLRVQRLDRKDGLRSYTIVWPEGAVHEEADGFLRTLEPGTDRTYAYLLVDHLRWLERECLALDVVSLRDLERYMGAVGAKTHGPFGVPWREGRRPYGNSALSGLTMHVLGRPTGVLSPVSHADGFVAASTRTRPANRIVTSAPLDLHTCQKPRLIEFHRGGTDLLAALNEPHHS
jgi:hypothetical protein